MPKLTNLEKVLNELNQDKIIDDEKFESEFHFEYKIDGNLLYIYDTNENYSYSYEQDMNDSLYELALEFGFTHTYQKDTVMPKIEKAIKDDLGIDLVDWETSHRMVVCLGD